MESHTDSGRFVCVTPAGSYHAVELRQHTEHRQLLHSILGSRQSPALADYKGGSREILLDLHKAGFITFKGSRVELPDGNLLQLLPRILPSLSESGRAVLTESGQGLYLDYVGVSELEAQELAVMAAALSTLADARGSVMSEQLAIKSRAFGIVDPAGNSEIGFWPLHIADQVFTLIVMGIPRFNTVPFCVLIWALIERYGDVHPV